MQAFLTSAIEFVAIVGFSGIVAHAFYSSNKKWYETYCPPVKPYEEYLKEEEAKKEEISKTEEEIVEKPEEPIAEMPKEEEIIPVVPSPEPSVDFSKMTLKQLVALCKADTKKYAGYTSIQKKGGKTGLATWMQTV